LVNDYEKTVWSRAAIVTLFAVGATAQAPTANEFSDFDGADELSAGRCERLHFPGREPGPTNVGYYAMILTNDARRSGIRS